MNAILDNSTHTCNHCGVMFHDDSNRGFCSRACGRVANIHGRARKERENLQLAEFIGEA